MSLTSPQTASRPTTSRIKLSAILFRVPIKKNGISSADKYSGHLCLETCPATPDEIHSYTIRNEALGDTATHTRDNGESGSGSCNELCPTANDDDYEKASNGGAPSKKQFQNRSTNLTPELATTPTKFKQYLEHSPKAPLPRLEAPQPSPFLYHGRQHRTLWVP